MDTWEVVLILILLTIAISVIAKHEVPLALVTLLDNIYFQLAILGLTLGVAVVSPPVALVAVATIVIIYYIRNIVKIQIAQMNKKIEEEARRDFDRQQAAKSAKAEETKEEDSPRIEITEERRVINIKSGNDTIDAALKEHETRPTSYSKDIGHRSTMGGMLSAEKEIEPPRLEMPNPRGEVKTVESFDMQASFNSPAPKANEDKHVVHEVDSDVFAKAGNVVPHNEDKAKPVERQYSDSAGQYPIYEARVQSKPEKFEQLDFMPMSDMGSNKFEKVGISIDDKMTILKKGLLPSSNPPPDYNMTEPPRASSQ